MRKIVVASLVLLAGCGQPSSGNCSRTSVGIAPLSDAAAGSYETYARGLYPGGSNARPASHEAAGAALASGLTPLDASGAADPSGKYALVSIGMSNTTMEFSAFLPLANGDALKDPHLVAVDGAQGGMTAAKWADGSCTCWTTLDQRLAAAGVSAPQVTVAWIKLADAQPTTGFPAYARTLQAETETILAMLKQRFPNLALAYLSSRIYAGYATGNLNPEPYAFEGGLAVRWVIEDQLAGVAAMNYDPANGAVRVPWVAWGPYLWADGLEARAGDGLRWVCSELGSDGTHPSDAGRRKVAQLLLDFFHNDSTARQWYLAAP